MPPVLLALILAAQAPSDETLAELTRTYADACGGRLYGQFDDMCAGLADQIRVYRAQARRRPPPGPAPAAPPATSLPPLASPPASHEPLAPASPR